MRSKKPGLPKLRKPIPQKTGGPMRDRRKALTTEEAVEEAMEERTEEPEDFVFGSWSEWFSGKIR